MKNTLIAILAIAVIVVGYLFIKEKTKPTDYSNAWPETVPATSTNNNSSQGTSTSVSGLKLFTRANYSFRAPSSWKETGPSDIGGCAWDGVANDTNDGLRQAGEIGIYPKSCFDLDHADYTEMTEKDGFYILAYYSRENGTTAAEETETKAVYQAIVNSFEVSQNPSLNGNQTTWIKSPVLGLSYSNAFNTAQELYVDGSGREVTNGSPRFEAILKNNNDTVIAWGGYNSECSVNDYGVFQYGISSITCLKGRYSSISHFSARATVTPEEKKLFGDFVLKNQ